MQMVKVKPFGDDLSIVSFSYDEVYVETDTDGNTRKADLDEKGENKKAKKNRSRLSQFFTTWTSTVSEFVGITGLRHITSSQDSALRRFVWFMAVLGGLTALVYQVTDRTVFFVGNYKSVDVEIEHVSELVFPAITICNYNRFRNLGLEDLPFGKMLAQINSFTPTPFNFSYYESLMTDINTTEMYLSLAHIMDRGEMFHLGRWDISSFVTPQSFTRVITDFGVCHTFNGGFDGGELKKIHLAGKGHGLTLMLDMQQKHYYYAKSLQYSAGFAVAVHDQDDIPQVESFGVAVAPGTETMISIKKRQGVVSHNVLYYQQLSVDGYQSKNLPPPYGVCGSRDLKYFYSPYSMLKCQRECLIDYIHAECGCVEPYMAVSSNLTVCNPAIVFSCVHSLSDTFNVKDECDCPVPCSSTTYSTSLSHSRLPSEFYNQILLDFFVTLGLQKEDDYLLTSTAMIQLFFEEMTTETITQQEAYSLFAFLCDIGGSMGLWLGGSILTVVEVFDHLLYSAFSEGANK